MADNSYDIAVIGAGTAGLTAALLATRYGMKTIVLERLASGGQVLNAERIENFPGLKDGIMGIEYGILLQEHAEENGAEMQMAQVSNLRLEDPYRVLITSEDEIRSKAVIVAAGSTLRRLGVPGEKELDGRGVSYCATCDGAFFTDQVVAVVGGGDSALDEAETLVQFASEVNIIHRRNSLRGQQMLQDRVLSESKVKMLWNATVEKVLGTEMVTGVGTRDVVTGETSQVDLSGLFIYVGLEPNTMFLKDILPLDRARPYPHRHLDGDGRAGHLRGRGYPAALRFTADHRSGRWCHRRHRRLPLYSGSGLALVRLIFRR